MWSRHTLKHEREELQLQESITRSRVFIQATDVQSRSGIPIVKSLAEQQMFNILKRTFDVALHIPVYCLSWTTMESTST